MMNVINGSSENKSRLVLICRLCGDASDSYINIFGEEGTRYTINTRILSYLKVEVSNLDLLPKVICNVCFHKLEEFHNFFLTSKKVQLLLKNTINESLCSIKIKIGLLKSETSNNHPIALTKTDHVPYSFDEVKGTQVKKSLIDKEESLRFPNDDENEKKEKNENMTTYSPITENAYNKLKNDNFNNKQILGTNAINNDIFEYQGISKSVQTKENTVAENSIELLQQKDHQNTADSSYNKYAALNNTNFLFQTNITANSFNYNYDETNLFQNTELNAVKQLDRLATSTESWINSHEQKSACESDSDLINISIRLPCTSCTQIFMCPKELIKHYNQQHCNTTPTFKCITCGRMYKVLKNFHMHYHKHDNVNKHICKVCGKSFTRNWTLRVHASVHSDAKPFNCDECDKSFKNLKSLKNHKKIHLPDECKQIYTCAYCGKSFKSKFILTTHERIHTGQKDFTCDLCGKSFANKSSLLYHITIHNYSKNIKCHLCNKLIRTERLLKRHLAFHSVKKQWKCEYCGKQYRYTTQLNEHRRLHTGELPFECEYCQKRFRLNSTLIIHRRQHTGIKPYKCKVCDHSFTNWSNYNKHMKRKHYNTIVGEKNDELILLKI